ncbi:sex-determining protein fem-1 [Aphelenchoides avenae]|nr:sex-determining protein fem-1 [Aphelenchus avenae]
MAGEEYSPVLSNAARDGNLTRLKIFLELRPEDWLQRALNPTDGTHIPPIVIASRYGHVDVVRYLISKGADASAVGTVSFDGETIHGAPALWAAAAGGHLEVVKLLVSQGIDINQPTNTNSTPLRGACYDGHLNIVKFLVDHGADIEIPNRHGHTALMIASYREKVDVVKYLLELKADVNRFSAKGNTALHDAAEAGNVEVTRLLLESGAVLQQDEYGVSPLYSAAMLAHTEVIQVLFPHASYVDKRDCWKLLGATMIDKRMDMSSAIACWRNSFEYDSLIRVSGDREEMREISDVATKIYGGQKEIMTVAELDEISGDPEALRLQALVVRERILGDFHPETHYYLRYRGAVFCDMGRWDKAFEMWMYLLQLQQNYFAPLHNNTVSTITAFTETFHSLVDELLVHPENRGVNEVVAVQQVVLVLERAALELERHIHREQEEEKELETLLEDTDHNKAIGVMLSDMLCLVHLVTRVALLDHQHNRNGSMAADVAQLAHSLFDMANNNQHANRNAVADAAVDASFRSRTTSMAISQTMFSSGTFNLTEMCAKARLTPLSERLPPAPKAVYQPRPACDHLLCVVRRMVKIVEYLGISPLNVACEEKDAADTKRYPSHFVISRLLLAGADVTKADENGNTPLHVLLTNPKPRANIIKLLLESNAPLMARNKEGVTCLQLIQRRIPNVVSQLRIGRFFSLKQIASNAVMRNEATSQQISSLPLSLQSYVKTF